MAQFLDDEGLAALDALATSVSGSRIPQTPDELLSAIPTSTNPLADLLEFTSDLRESAPASTRIPIHWFARIDEIREKVGSRLPNNLWKTRGEFIRWSIGHGLSKAAEIQRLLDEAPEEGVAPKPLDPILGAQLFVAKTTGNLKARADIMSDTREAAERIVEAIQSLIELEEFAESADMINEWVDGARVLRERDGSAFWERFFVEVLTRAPGMPSVLTQLIDGGHIVDELLVDQYDHFVELAGKQADAATDPDLDLTGLAPTPVILPNSRRASSNAGPPI